MVGVTGYRPSGSSVVESGANACAGSSSCSGADWSYIGMIIGIVLGCLVALGFTWYFVRKCLKKRKAAGKAQQSSAASTNYDALPQNDASTTAFNSAGTDVEKGYGGGR